MFSYSRALLTEPGLQALLGPGEQALAAVTVAPALSGAEKIAEPPPPIEPAGEELGPLGKVAGGALAAASAAIGPTGWSGGDLPLRALGGYRVVGDIRSGGVALHRALSTSGVGRYLVVTPQRLLLVSGGLSGATKQAAFEQLFAAPRPELVAARRRGRLGARGRVELYFRDGSMVAVMTGAISTGPATRLLQALGVPSDPPSA